MQVSISTTPIPAFLSRIGRGQTDYLHWELLAAIVEGAKVFTDPANSQSRIPTVGSTARSLGAGALGVLKSAIRYDPLNLQNSAAIAARRVQRVSTQLLS